MPCIPSSGHHPLQASLTRPCRYKREKTRFWRNIITPTAHSLLLRSYCLLLACLLAVLLHVYRIYTHPVVLVVVLPLLMLLLLDCFSLLAALAPSSVSKLCDYALPRAPYHSLLLLLTPSDVCESWCSARSTLSLPLSLSLLALYLVSLSIPLSLSLFLFSSLIYFPDPSLFLRFWFYILQLVCCIYSIPWRKSAVLYISIYKYIYVYIYELKSRYSSMYSSLSLSSFLRLIYAHLSLCVRLAG